MPVMKALWVHMSEHMGSNICVKASNLSMRSRRGKRRHWTAFPQNLQQKEFSHNSGQATLVTTSSWRVGRAVREKVEKLDHLLIHFEECIQLYEKSKHCIWFLFYSTVKHPLRASMTIAKRRTRKKHSKPNIPRSNKEAAGECFRHVCSFSQQNPKYNLHFRSAKVYT